MYYVFDSHILFFLIYDHICIPYWADIFSLFIPISFEIVYKCVSIQNTNDHAVLSDSNIYLTFVSLTCSFTSIIS